MSKTNIAFKCNFCNGGSTAKYYGYNGVCSDQVIEYNIKKMKYEWCSYPDSSCSKYYNGKITREVLEKLYAEKDFVCYESSMLKYWQALAGRDHNGEKGDCPRKILNSQEGSLAILTLVTPNEKEYNRRIFAVFIIDKYFIGDDEQEGYVQVEAKYRLHFTKLECNDFKFWDYYVNSNGAAPKWGSGLFRYLSDEQSLKILEQAVVLKLGTEDELLAKEMLKQFCKNKNLKDICKIN